MKMDNTQGINKMFSNRYAKEDPFQFDGILDFSSQFAEGYGNPVWAKGIINKTLEHPIGEQPWM